MPRIDAINKYDYYHINKNLFLIENNANEEYKLFQDLKNDIKSLNEDIRDFIGGEKEISKLIDKETLELNGGFPLKELANNLQKDVSEFVDEVSNSNKLYKAFHAEVVEHRLEEATRVWELVREEYGKKIKKIGEEITSYNKQERLYNRDEETGDYKVGYYDANPGEIVNNESKYPGVVYSGGYKKNTNPSRPGDFRGNSLIKGIEDAVSDANEFYTTYVKEAKEKYDHFKAVPQEDIPKVSISKDLVNILKGDKKDKTKSKKETENVQNSFVRDKYEFAAHLTDSSGDFILYKSKENNKYYVFDLDGKPHEAYFNGTEVLTEAKLKNITKTGYITVRTGADFGRHTFDINDEVIIINSSEEIQNIKRDNTKTPVFTYNGYNVCMGEDQGAYIETYPGVYKEITKNGKQAKIYGTNKEGQTEYLLGFDINGVGESSANPTGYKVGNHTLEAEGFKY